jgi:hypothetical protein
MYVSITSWLAIISDNSLTFIIAIYALSGLLGRRRGMIIANRICARYILKDTVASSYITP